MWRCVCARVSVCGIHTQRLSCWLHFTGTDVPQPITRDCCVHIWLASSNEGISYTGTRGTEKMDICSSCVGPRAIDSTRHAPYQSPPPSEELFTGPCISWSYRCRGYLIPVGMWKELSDRRHQRPKAWMNTIIVWLECEWLACACVSVCVV